MKNETQNFSRDFYLATEILELTSTSVPYVTSVVMCVDPLTDGRSCAQHVSASEIHAPVGPCHSKWSC